MYVCMYVYYITEVRESEYVDVALIVLRLITNFQASAVMRSQRAQAQLEALGAFTCALMQACPPLFLFLSLLLLLGSGPRGAPSTHQRAIVYR